MVADSFLKRLFGLMGKKPLSENSGLLITPCNSIHMFFMRFPIDVIFLDKSLAVIALYENLQPWKITKIYKKSKSVIELPVGTIKQSKTSIGNNIEII